MESFKKGSNDVIYVHDVIYNMKFDCWGAGAKLEVQSVTIVVQARDDVGLDCGGGV